MAAALRAVVAAAVVLAVVVAAAAAAVAFARMAAAVAPELLQQRCPGARQPTVRAADAWPPVKTKIPPCP